MSEPNYSRSCNMWMFPQNNGLNWWGCGCMGRFAEDNGGAVRQRAMPRMQHLIWDEDAAALGPECSPGMAHLPLLWTRPPSYGRSWELLCDCVFPRRLRFRLLCTGRGVIINSSLSLKPWPAWLRLGRAVSEVCAQWTRIGGDFIHGGGS